VTCILYEEQLSSYLDGELPRARAARVEAHLKVCPHCQAELDALGGIATHLRAASNSLRVSHDFDRRVLRAVGYWQVTGWQRPTKSYLRQLVWVAVTLLGMLAGVWHYFTRPFEPPPTWAPQPAMPVVAPATPNAPIPIAPQKANHPDRR
jgi:anti-sigma factor RsiW